jgi:threonine dehydrogenase-like Zn-dependent dehydrogenase
LGGGGAVSKLSGHIPSAFAARLEGDGKVDVIQFAPPAPGPDEVRVRLEGSGVCASNLPVWEGRSWFQYPLALGAPGHEGWGVIDALGPAVAGLEIGDRVAALSYHAYAQYDFAAAHAVVKLPPDLDGQPFPGEALGCAMNIFARSDIQAGQTIAIIGMGFLGILLTELATRAGARVIAVSRRPFALDMAREYGAVVAVRSNDAVRAGQQVQTAAGEDGCDRVIEVTGHQSALDLATHIVRVRGRLVIAGYHQDAPRSIDMQTWNWKGLDVINAHERAPKAYLQGMERAVEAVVTDRLHPAPLYTHKYELDELRQAFETLRARPEGFIKALLIA